MTWPDDGSVGEWMGGWKADRLDCDDGRDNNYEQIESERR